uniref:Uncharacterized protein n=1 Tax=Oryza nivara TaxID=4536 RepID=A0A0E0IE75_ORYNI
MSMNLSGMNSSGLSHAAGSRMIAHTLKITPPISAPSSSARCGTRIGAAGCRRIASLSTAWRLASFGRNLQQPQEAKLNHWYNDVISNHWSLRTNIRLFGLVPFIVTPMLYMPRIISLPFDCLF